MKRVLLLTTIGVLCFVAITRAQNVFNPADPIVRNSGTATSPTHPDENIQGLQKWVTTSTSGVSTGSNSFDASSFKSYYINLGGAKLSFRLKFPKSYTNPDSATKKYPVMMFLHGAGEPGCPSNGGLYNNEKQLLHGGKVFRDYVDNNQFDGYLLYPQNNTTSTSCWAEWGIAPFSPYYNLFINVIDSLVKYARLDIDKVVTTGLSNGGASDWSMSSAYPMRVTKNAPSSAATGATNFPEFVHIPVWFATGGKDTNPTPGFAGATYDNLKTIGADIRWTLYPDLGHSVWYNHWAEPGFVQWMNDMHKANPLVYFQRNAFCPDSAISVKIGITRGFAEYEWRKDGQLLATAVRTSANPPYAYSTVINQPAVVTAFTGNDVTVKSYGSYIVRFRRTPGGAWSEYSPKPAVISPKIITNTPAIALDGLRSKVLPAPDGSTTAPLQLPPGYSKYEWYRNDVLVDTGRRYAAIPGLYKAKAYEQFGCGSIFSSVYTVISTNGSPKPDPALNLSAVVENLVNIRLRWNQNPNAGENETGFEIYRSTGGAGGPYELLTITGPDVSTYLDEKRPSNSTGYYVVRAIGNYGGAAVSNEASTSTPTDNVAPTAPSGLTAVCVTRDKVTLRWNASTDNVSVAVYDIYVNGSKSYSTTNTRFEVWGLTANAQYFFSVKAKDPTGNTSQPSNQATGHTHSQGVCYKVFNGTWELLPDFNAMTPVAEGMQAAPDLATIPGGSGDNFGVLWEGHINRTSSANNVRFNICSDDGARLYVNGYYKPTSTGTLDNDGVHGETCLESTSNTNMNSGTAYPFAFAYFEQGGGQVARLQWRTGTSGAYATIPAANFAQAGSGGTVPNNPPSNLVATAFNYKQINLTWTDASNNETGFEIVRATAAAGPFLPKATVGAGVNSFQDTGLNASTQYWYQVRAINNNGASNYTASATATTQAPPAGPTAPSNLVASTPAMATVQLTWNDNSNNETGFEIWRSVGGNTDFQLLATAAGGAGAQKTYVDAPVFANVHYFYKVRAGGSPTPSGYTGEVTASTANSRPDLIQVQDFSVRQGSSVSVPINATDPDGDPMVFLAPGLPYFAQIQTVSNGNANLVVNPPSGEQGGYTLRLIVDDGFGGKDTVRFTIIVNDNSLPALNAISDVTINEGDSITIPITATDAEMSQYFTWATKNMPAWGKLTNNGNGSASLKLKPTYSSSGLYNMSVLVDDGFGAWTSRTFNIVVVETDPNETVQINFRYFTGFQPLWNDIPLFGNPTFNVGNMINKKNQVTTVGIQSTSVGGGIAGADNGMQPGGTGIFPDAIMKDQLKVGYGGGSDVMTMQVRGLDPNKKYNFIFFASDNGAEAWRGYNANTQTSWTINGQTAVVKVWQNTNMTDTIYQIQPNASGQVNITMTGDPSVNVGAILNAMVVDAQFDDGTTPAKPTNISAQVVPNTGVRVNWNDIAYNENSYRVYRSTSATGPFTALTPDAQKDSVRYLDNTTAPYTQYYYYVRGVNQLGLGVSSDTVGAVTGNNLPMITGLADLAAKTGGTAQDDFSVSDNAGDVLTVSLLNKPSYVTLTSLGGNNYRITATPTIDNIGWDYLTVEVRDDKGGVITRAVGVTVTDATTRSVFVNFGNNVPAAAPWNNVMGYGNVNTTVTGLRDEANVVTPFGLVLLDGWDGVTENGQRTGNNSGVFPDSVLAGGYFDFGTTDMRIRFTGLNPAKRYNIVLVASQNEGYKSEVKYVTTGSSDTLNARNNSNNSANLNNLTPDASGNILVTMTKIGVSQYMFLNGVQIEEFDPTTIVRQPLNLYVEGRLDKTSVVLTWSDRSGNETGFTVQRSTDSTFVSGVTSTTVGTIGASTTTITSLSTNTRYWFRVRANGTVNSDWSNKVKVITPETMVLVNFNFSVQDVNSPWNNTQALPNFTGTWAGLINDAPEPTSTIMSIERIFNGEYAFGLNATSISGYNNTDHLLESSYWIDRSQIATIRFSGLNQAKRYRFGFTAGIDNALFSGDMTMSYTINGRTVYLNSFFNTTKIVWIGDVAPDANGEVLITFSTPNRTSIVYGFTSGIMIQSYDDAQGGQNPNIVKQTPGQEEPVLQTAQAVPQVTVATQEGMDARMYPNPFIDQINLDFNNTSAGNNIAVDVYDMSGRLVYRRNFGRLSAGYNTLRLNTAEGKLNTGVYMVSLTVNGKPVQVTKMIRDAVK